MVTWKKPCALKEVCAAVALQTKLSYGSRRNLRYGRRQDPQEESALDQPPAIRAFDSDIDALIALSADDHVNRFLRRGPFACRDDAHRFLHAYVLPHPWYRAICLSGAGVVGSIFLRPSSLAGRGELLRSASLGYRVAGEFWGRGIATEAVRMATAAAFEEWPELERVEAIVDLENPASQRVLEKAGFTREAVLRRYLILKGEVRDVVMTSFVSSDRASGSSKG
ncbi:hypothetical protein HPP92_011776 [Vanilla planifolia]|uniref:N-acetyltransferase domain-containing protein n=1 Tax=Vanilla planifolia TaxID=51239 RepID=A0A835RC90_VANPL|nr:hypothetical protein HPP92_012129 [Vanilla planifolia]KAG0483692.1 hypothetical protein HPP92_011776 [Vanilla planifolia]